MHQVTPATNFPIPDLLVLPTRDGSNTVFSQAFGATFHSLHGAVAESRHVFIQYGLGARLAAGRLRVLEFGFGTGLNALLARSYADARQREILYTGIETMPLPIRIVRQLEYPGYIGRPDLEPFFMQMHTEEVFSVPGFRFQRIRSLDGLEPEVGFDVVFFDAFAPGDQPEVWSKDMFQRLASLMGRDSLLVTYCAQGEVRRRLQQAGFSVERLPGPLGKREMLRARKD